MSGQVEVDGAKLFYEEDGTGEPVLFIHGHMLDRRMWDPQVEPFAGRHRVIRMDVRGFGRSEYHPGPYSDHGDVRGLLRSLNVGETHVVGLSMGAGIGLEFALMHPEATTSLTVVPGGIPGHELPPWFDSGYEEFVSAARDGDFRRAADLVMDFAPMRPAARLPALRTALMSMIAEYTWVNLLDDYGDWRPIEPSVYERLEDVSCPTLVISGDLDIEEFREEADILAARIPRTELVRVAGAGHMVNMERPAEFNAAVLAFLSRLANH
jgi:pimeloyl-ACP methyl ester carboxylesterase